MKIQNTSLTPVRSDNERAAHRGWEASFLTALDAPDRTTRFHGVVRLVDVYSGFDRERMTVHPDPRKQRQIESMLARITGPGGSHAASYDAHLAYFMILNTKGDSAGVRRELAMLERLRP